MTTSKFAPFRAACAVGVFVYVLALGASSSGAQMGSQGTVNIIVFDQSGSVIQGAKLNLQDVATNDARTAETRQAGTYSFVALPIGNYRLTVSMSGFETAMFDSVVVQGGRVTDMKITLKIGASLAKVVVSESAAPLIDTTSNALATTIDMKQIESLPLQGRNISNLALLTPGYSGTPGGGTWNGLPVIAQGNSIDGVISSTSRMKFGGNVRPGLEARLEDIQEMTVQTSQVELNQGLGTSAMLVSFVTRRGSNSFHGRAFEDFRNDAMNANTWTNNALVLRPGQTRPKNRLILNEFGVSVGGRIIKDKLFFFGSYAEAKQPGSFSVSRTFLTPAAQQGIFTYPSSGQTVNLFTQVAQPNGLPAAVNAQIGSQQALINKAVSSGIGVVSSSGDPNLQQINWQVSAPITRYYPALRLDYNLSQKLRMDFAWQETKFSRPNDAPPPFPGPDFVDRAASRRTNNYTTSLGLTWTITPSLLNQFRGGYYYNAAWNAHGGTPLWETQPQVSWALASSGQSFNLPVTTYYPIVNFSDNATWVHRSHAATFGISFYREQDHYWNPPDGIPNIFMGLVNGDPAFDAFERYFASASSADRGAAENLYATLVGRISAVTPIGSGFPYDMKTGQYATVPGKAYNLNELQKGWGLYAQDSFRVKPTLTLNYGLRWDFTGDAHDLTSAYHGASAAAMYGPSGPGNIFKPGTLTGDMNPAYVASSHQYKPWNVSPQPTIGLAWNPNYSSGVLGRFLGGGKTVIRAGFDIKRFTEPYQYFWNNASNHGLAFFQFFSLRPDSAGGTGKFRPGSLQLGDPLPPFLKSPAAYAASIPQSVYTWNYFWGGAGFDPNIPQPYVQEWNLGIQRQLGPNNVLEVRYVGHRSVHQWNQVDPNEVNIFENGFLDQFKIAQSNLAINRANGRGASFANNGLPGQQPLPFFDAAFRCPPGAPASCTPGADYANPSFVTMLNQGAAGQLATQLAYPGGRVPYICNLVGSPLTPCAAQYGFTSAGPYPLNVFQANPYAAGVRGVQQSLLTAGGYGNYHALQVDFRQRQWHGMQFDVNYTWSHTLGTQPDGEWLGTTNQFTMRNPRLGYGPTVFDLRHVVHASGTYDLPFGSGKTLLNHKGPVDRIVGGWTLGTIFTWETGFPLRLTGGYNTFNDYADGGLVLSGVTVSQLQDSIGVYHPAANQCPGLGTGLFAYTINPALLRACNPSYTPPANCSTNVAGVCQNMNPGTFGVNTFLYGPRLWNADLSITKVIPIREKLRFSLQGEFLNLFNHPNWANPNGSISSQGFGRAGLSNMNNPRLVEIRANLEF